MPVPRLARTHSREPTLVAVQDKVQSTFATSLPVWLRHGVLMEGVALAASNTNRVVHKLGAVPRGVVVLEVQQATGATFDQIIVVSKDKLAVVLNAAAACTVTLWIWR